MKPGIRSPFPKKFTRTSATGFIKSGNTTRTLSQQGDLKESHEGNNPTALAMIIVIILLLIVIFKFAC